MTHGKYFLFGVPLRPPIEAEALAPIHASSPVLFA